MTHLIRYSQLKSSRLFKQEICDAVTLIECPPLFIYGLTIYTYSGIYLQKFNTIISYFYEKNKNIFRVEKKELINKFESIVIMNRKEISVLFTKSFISSYIMLFYIIKKK